MDFKEYLDEYIKAKKLCELIAIQIQKITGRSVSLKDHEKQIGFSFYAPKNFASASWEKTDQKIVIDTNQIWAIGARVSHLADASMPNGWHKTGQPNSIWYVQKDDVGKRIRVAGYLASVCNYRHR